MPANRDRQESRAAGKNAAPDPESVNSQPPTIDDPDIEMQNQADLHLETDADTHIATHAQGQKRKAGKLADNRPNPQPSQANSTTNQSRNNATPQETSENIQSAKAARTVQADTAPPKVTSGTRVYKAVQKAQEQARKEVELKNSMCGRIAKAVDDAMEAEAPGTIEDHQIQHIVSAILDCALPRPVLLEKISQKRADQGKSIVQMEDKNTTQHKETLPTSANPDTWAKVAAQKGKPEAERPTLSYPLKRARPDERLMVRLGPESPHRAEHPFVLQKKANAALPNKTVVGKVAISIRVLH